jgi:hypothetical protein
VTHIKTVKERQVGVADRMGEGGGRGAESFEIRESLVLQKSFNILWTARSFSRSKRVEEEKRI